MTVFTLICAVFATGLHGLDAVRTEDATMNELQMGGACSEIADSAEVELKEAEKQLEAANEVADSAKAAWAQAKKKSEAAKTAAEEAEALAKAAKTAAEEAEALAKAKEKQAVTAENFMLKKSDLVQKMKDYEDQCSACKWEYDYGTFKCKPIIPGKYYVKNVEFGDYVRCNEGNAYHMKPYKKSSLFTMTVSGTTVTFKNEWTGKYLKAIDKAGGSGAACNSKKANSWERFTAEAQGNGKFAFKTAHGLYLRATHSNNEKAMDAEGSGTPGNQEFFTLEACKGDECT